MEPENEEFIADYKTFQEKCTELDIRLAAIAVQAFEEANDITSIVKVYDNIYYLKFNLHDANKST